MHIDDFLSQYHLLIKDYSFSVELLWHLCQRLDGHINMGVFLDYLFCSIDLCISPPIPHSLDYCSFIVSHEIQQGESSNLFSFTKFFELFQYFCPTIYCLRMSLSTATKPCLDFDLYCMKSIDQFGENCNCWYVVF